MLETIGLSIYLAAAMLPFWRSENLAIEIDGGQGEGGGQIVRTAIALASALGKDVHIFNIRKGRNQPGLRPQHLAGISLAGEMCDANISGLEVGSTEIRFEPGTNTGGEYEKDIGTAGSISLLLQSCIIPALFSKSSTRLKVKGGTDVPWSPPMDYLNLVLFPILRRMGAGIEIEIEQRGFYPSGGGEVIVDIAPIGKMKALNLLERGGLKEITGSIVCRNLPAHIADRIKNSAIKELSSYPSPRMTIDISNGPSTGVSFVIEAIFENTILGASMLGEKGLPAEKVGELTAKNLIEEINNDGTLDEHATDQIVPFLFLADGKSAFRTAELTLHARTNISIVQQFLGRKIVTTGKNGLVDVSVK